MNRFLSKKRAFIAVCFFLTCAMIYATGSSQQPAAGAGGKQTLQVAIQQPANVADFKDNFLTSYLEKLHNISIDFYTLPLDSAESRTKIALMAASNDLPETIWAGGMTRELIFEYGTSGKLVALNKYYNDASKTPYFNKIPEADRKTILMDISNPDGNIYSFARYEPQSWNLTPFRYYINRAWLTKLGLQEPKTTDDLRNVLIAFRDRDPNGNGRKDEIGVFGFYNGGYGEDTITALINCFVYYNPGAVSSLNPGSSVGNIELDNTGNNVIASFVQPGFRKALQYLNGLFRDGLLDASTFTVDQQSFRATLNANPSVVGITTAGSVGNFPGYNTDSQSYKDRAPIMAPLTGPDGISYTPYSPYSAEQMTFITNKAKNVDLAVKVMDSFYEDNLSMITRFGEENVDWTRDPARLRTTTNPYIEMGIFPSLTMATLKDIWTIPQTKHWGNQTPRYYPFEKAETGGDLSTTYDPSKYYLTHGAVNYQYYLPKHPQYILPLLHYTDSDASTLSQPIINITSYVRQSIAEFTIGTRDINNDTAWNAYLRELDNMGLQQWLRIAQTTYNRQK